MIEKMDQIFVLLQHWLVSFLPAWLQQAASVLHPRLHGRLWVGIYRAIAHGRQLEQVAS